jgi:imidazole glycerol-phosphate synthase subunit HisF
MLKTRVMPTLLHKDLGLVKGVRFDSWRRVGSAMQAVKVYNMREVDELVFLDITATREGRAPDYELVDDLADECFMPMTVGGGVRTVEHFERLLKVGADKVAVNTAVIDRPEVITEAAETFGAQCVVVSIDALRSPDGALDVLTHSGTTPTGREPAELAAEAQERGAGEILLTSIDRDGTLEGYDLELVRAVASAVTIPVIASGGAGTYAHMAAAILEGGASAVAAASMFHFTEQTPLEAKHHLRDCGVAVRI